MLGSNQRPPPCRDGALPAELIALGSRKCSVRGRGEEGYTAVDVEEAPDECAGAGVRGHRSRSCGCAGRRNGHRGQAQARQAEHLVRSELQGAAERCSDRIHAGHLHGLREHEQLTFERLHVV